MTACLPGACAAALSTARAASLHFKVHWWRKRYDHPRCAERAQTNNLRKIAVLEGTVLTQGASPAWSRRQRA